MCTFNQFTENSSETKQGRSIKTYTLSAYYTRDSADYSEASGKALGEEDTKSEVKSYKTLQ